VVEQVAIPDELIPADARVEMDAKTAAGYFTPVAPPAPPNWPSPRAGSFTHECSDRPPRPGWHTPVPAGHPAASLLTARAVRSRCGIVMAQVEAGRSPSSPGTRNTCPCAPSTWPTPSASTTRIWTCPTTPLAPFRGRRGGSLGALLATSGLDGDRLEAARVAVDLVIPSVLLDAGAGPDWHYRDAASGQRLSRSEGLGVASLALFAGGALSADAAHPCAAMPAPSSIWRRRPWPRPSRSGRPIRWSGWTGAWPCCSASAR
jgi:hypothetical protein